MIGKAFLPTPILRQYIKGYQLWHFVFSDADKLPFKPYAPRPENTIVFYPRGFELVEYPNSGKMIKRPAAMVIGQYTERTNRHLGSSESLILLVTFQPGVLHRLTRIPLYELTNTFADAEAIFSKEIHYINERLNNACDYDEMISIVESFLIHLMRDMKQECHPLDTVANLIIEHPETTSVISLARESFLCTRQFERKFKERIGVSPKLFARIARLDKAFRTKYNHPKSDWLGIALQCGYHDYQHLSKDFSELAGATPAGYLLDDYNNAPERFFGMPDSSLM